jgi:molybdopterin synthase catalytic subunit
LKQRAIPPDCGAVVTFLGVVRDLEDGRKIAALDYEGHREMAEHQFRKILAQAGQRWPVSQLDLVHRLGRIAVGEPSLWIQVVAGHRAEAFAACQFVIDELKKVVPIWKMIPGASAEES